MPEKHLHVTMPDGSVWSVPLQVIAEKRAAHYAAREARTNSGAEYDRCYAEWLARPTHPDQYVNWACNNMHWEHVVPYAKQVEIARTTDYQEGWANGDMKVVEE